MNEDLIYFKMRYNLERSKMSKVITVLGCEKRSDETGKVHQDSHENNGCIGNKEPSAIYEEVILVFIVVLTHLILL